MKSIWRGLMFLLVGALTGYAVGLLLDLSVTGAGLDLKAPVAAWLAVFIGLTAFFFGLAGLNAVSRGLIWQFIGIVVGGSFITLIRWIMNLRDPSRDLEVFGSMFFTEPAWVFGAFLGGLFFLFGNGSTVDWFKWMRGIDTPEHHEEHFHGGEKYL